jgi:GAF domain-containing protein
MPGESTQSILTNPFVIVIALVFVAVLAVLAVYFFSRSRRSAGQSEQALQSQLLDMERENQFAAAAEQMPYFTDAETAGRETATLFREYLSMPMLAIYAGREGDPKHRNILSKESGAAEKQTDSLLLKSLPDSIPSSSISRYWGPQVEKLSAITGGASLAAYNDQHAQGQTHEPPPAPVTGPLEDRTQPNAQVGVEASQNPAPDPDVIALPWRGPFNWHGLMVARALGPANAEILGRLREPLARIGDRLSVALQFQQSSAQMTALDERASRSLDFSYALFSSLEDPSPLASIAREITYLLGANSGALWRVEPGTGMVRMVAAHGLKSAEFLPLPLGQGLAGSVAQSGEPVSLEDAPSDPRCIFPREARESGIGSYLGTPIFSDGKIVGVAEVHTTQPRQWNESDLRSLRSAALIIAEVFKSADARGNRLRAESAYLGLSEALQRLRAPDEVMEAAVEVLGHALGVSRAIIVQLDNNGRPLPVKSQYVVEPAKSALGAVFTEELSARLAQASQGEPVAIADSRKASLMGPEKAEALQVLSELAIPVRIENQTRAVLYLHQSDRTREWQRDEVEFADRVARQLSLSLSNLRSLEAVSRSAQAARDEASRTGGDAATRLRDLELKLAALERASGEARNSETQARAMLAKASAAEAKARAETEVVRRSETELRHERDRLHDNYSRVEASAQQLLEINRLKSEFIVNAGREIEAALQPVLGLAELLERGSYGPLNAEQREAVRGLYSSAKRIKSDVEWLIEYGSARSRRLEDGEATNA